MSFSNIVASVALIASTLSGADAAKYNVNRAELIHDGFIFAGLPLTRCVPIIAGGAFTKIFGKEVDGVLSFYEDGRCNERDTLNSRLVFNSSENRYDFVYTSHDMHQIPLCEGDDPRNCFDANASVPAFYRIPNMNDEATEEDLKTCHSGEELLGPEYANHYIKGNQVFFKDPNCRTSNFPFHAPCTIEVTDSSAWGCIFHSAPVEPCMRHHLKPGETCFLNENGEHKFYLKRMMPIENDEDKDEL